MSAYREAAGPGDFWHPDELWDGRCEDCGREDCSKDCGCEDCLPDCCENCEWRGHDNEAMKLSAVTGLEVDDFKLCPDCFTKEVKKRDLEHLDTYHPYGVQSSHDSR